VFTPPSIDRLEEGDEFQPRGLQVRRAERAWPKVRMASLLLGPGWIPAVGVALVVGGVGGVLPVGILGELGQGILAGALNGLAAACVAGPIWIAPLVAGVVCIEIESGISALRIASGISDRSLRWRRRTESVVAVGLTLSAASIIGVIGTVATNAFAGGEWSLGLDGWPGLGTLGLAFASLVVGVGLSVAISELFARRLLAIVLLEGWLLLTLAILGILYLVPILRPIQVFSPWVGVWPLRANEARSPLFATDIDPWVAGVTTGLWTIALVGAALVRGSSNVPKGYE